MFAVAVFLDSCVMTGRIVSFDIALEEFEKLDSLWSV